MDGWKTIESAPKDGTEVLCYREDAGVFVASYTAPCEFLSESECEELDAESAEQFDWFSADIVHGERLEGDLVPTHWMALPKGPGEG